MPSLQVYVQILLDICRENMENRPGELIDGYPMFKDMYQQIYDLCLDTERVVNMYSKELAILDRNTVLYMIDEMQEQHQQEISQKNQKISHMGQQISRQAQRISQQDMALTKKDQKLSQQAQQISQQDMALSQKDQEISQQAQEIAALRAQLAALR